MAIRTSFGVYYSHVDDRHWSKFEGRTLKAVKLAKDKATLTFVLDDNSKVSFGVEGDCCSRSWIEHLEAPVDVVGAKITGVEDDRIGRDELGDGGLRQSYKTVFHTTKGDIVLEYRNDSNGYYGGYLVAK